MTDEIDNELTLENRFLEARDKLRSRLLSLKEEAARIETLLSEPGLPAAPRNEAPAAVESTNGALEAGGQRLLSGSKSRGSQLFQQRLNEQGYTHRRAAELLVTSKTAISMWTTGQRSPTPEQRREIQKHLSVPAKAWDETPIDD